MRLLFLQQKDTSQEKRGTKMQKKKLIAAITAIALTAATPLAIHAYQVATTGSLTLGTTTMSGYLYRSSSSTYVFSAETRIASQPYDSASLSATVQVFPYDGSTVAPVSASTSKEQKIAVTTGTTSTDNASSASGTHTVTFYYDGTTTLSKTESTSWSKSNNNWFSMS